MMIPDLSILHQSGLNRNRLFKPYPEFCQYLDENYPQDLKFTEKIYWYLNNLQEAPRCICGNPVKFRNIKEGYSQYCSVKCSNSDSQKIQKTKDTCIAKYGHIAPAGSSEVQKKIQDSTMERYGVKNILEIKRRRGPLKEESIQKMKKTCLDRYGVEYAMQSKEIQDKSKRNKDFSQIAKKIWKTRHKNIVEKYDFLEEIGDLWVCKCPHPDCNKCEKRTYEVTPQIFNDRKRDGTEPCTILLPISKNNNKGTSIEIFIHQLLDEYNIEYEENNRTILEGKELDIYIPSKNIAIECNGIYSHCSIYKTSNYHYEKFLKCQKNGIQLLTLWEDWIKIKPEIVRSLVSSKLGIYQRRIGARSCDIRKVSSKDAGEFLEANHIQGKTGSQVRLGLYYKDELVALMTFGKKRACSGNQKDEGWDLSRFCSKKYLQVIGGAEKLLKYFIKEYNPYNIYSFASLDISNGDLYEKLGFKKEGYSQSYWWINRYKRYHRSSFTKAHIKEISEQKHLSLPENWTEKQIMYSWGYYQVYDCGTMKYVLNVQD